MQVRLVGLETKFIENNLATSPDQRITLRRREKQRECDFMMTKTFKLIAECVIIVEYFGEEKWVGQHDIFLLGCSIT